MKLSIVIDHRENKKACLKLFEQIFSETNLNYEVILFDQSKDDSIDVIFEKYKKFINKEELKIISTTGLNPAEVRRKSLNYVKGDYVIFIYSCDLLNKQFLDKMLTTMTVYGTDIIEFRVKHRNSLYLSFKYPRKMEKNIVYSVEERPEVYSYISPFLYSKAFKTSFMRNNISLMEIETNYDIFYSYLLTAFSKSYYFMNFVGLTVSPLFVNRKVESVIFNQWSYLLKLYKTYKNWEVSSKYIEYIYFKYMTKVGYKIIKTLVPDIFERSKTYKKLFAVMTKEFPEYMNNNLIKKERKIIKSKLIKKNTKKFIFFNKKK